MSDALRKAILEIIEREIVGDGQGYPHQGEREAAADAIVAMLAASPADVVGEIVAWLTFQAEGLERCAADERRFQPDRDEAALVAKELRWRIEHIASRFSTGDGWTLVAGNPPCAVGEQADVEFCSPGWACAHFGMVTNFGDHLDWSLYDQINDKFVSWASETPKFYRLRVPLPAPGETDEA